MAKPNHLQSACGSRTDIFAMEPLSFSATRHLLAAEGFLELGLLEDAVAELNHIPPTQRLHIDVLQFRWQLEATRTDWDAALTVARDLLRFAPDNGANWLHYAYALRRARDGGLDKAFAALEPAAQTFLAEPVIPFNLACYACQMGNLDQARQWLLRSIAIGGKKYITLMALNDDDLKPLWKEIEQL
jgi:tetratricopeptide (TPR) repeat protein